MPSKKTILLDFDGVLHDYRGWQGNENLNPPIEHARHACHLLARDFKLVCFTTRDVETVEKWLRRYGFPAMIVTNVKLPALVLVDDRAICFKGQWTDEFLNLIKNFKAHWESLDKNVEDASQHSPNPSSNPEDKPTPVE